MKRSHPPARPYRVVQHAESGQNFARIERGAQGESCTGAGARVCGRGGDPVCTFSMSLRPESSKWPGTFRVRQ